VPKVPHLQNSYAFSSATVSTYEPAVEPYSLIPKEGFTYLRHILVLWVGETRNINHRVFAGDVHSCLQIYC
jgi:hypothetical protein